jgi:hypothetical protein
MKTFRFFALSALIIAALFIGGCRNSNDTESPNNTLLTDVPIQSPDPSLVKDDMGKEQGVRPEKISAPANKNESPGLAPASNVTAISPDLSAIQYTTEQKMPEPGKESSETKWSELKNLMEKMTESTQTFTINSSEAQIINGRLGTVIYYEPGNQVTHDNKDPGKIIQVELKELLSKSQLLRENAQTISDKELLVSGGSYYIKMSSDGKELKIKDGKSIKVEFPRITKENMSLFTGDRDSLNQINWKDQNEEFLVGNSIAPSYMEARREKRLKRRLPIVEKITYRRGEKGYDTSWRYTDEITYESLDTTEKKLYAALNLKSFGWINCDRFYGRVPTTNLIVKANSEDNIPMVIMFLVFKDINSIMQSYFQTKLSGGIENGFSGIPLGKEVRFIAYTIKDGKIYSQAENLTIRPKEILQLNLKETNENELKKLLDGV